MDKNEAILAGETRYHGKICERHRELGGLRRVRSSACIGCETDARRIRLKVERERVRHYRRLAEEKAGGMDYKTAKLARQEAIASNTARYFGKVCEKHPECKGERLTHNGKCVGCKDDGQRLMEKRARERERVEHERIKHNQQITAPIQAGVIK